MRGGRRRGGPRPGGSRPRRGQRRGGPRRGGGRRREPQQPPPRAEPAKYEPPPAPPRPTELEPTDREFRGLRLFPFQVEALDAIADGHSVLVSAPTGAGKTLVADYAVETAFEQGWRVVYTSPIKALSNQKYRDYRALHGDQVGIMTGDVTINPDADLLVMTTEVFRNSLLEDASRFDEFRFVIHDEIHYLDDVERGTVWEESIIHSPPQMRLVGLSATIPNVRELADWVAELRHEDVTVVDMRKRPVPLDHRLWVPDAGAVPMDDGLAVLRQPFKIRRKMRRERTPERLLDWLQRDELLPALVFCFSRRDCETHALANRKRQFLTDAEQARMRELFDDLASRYECRPSPALTRLHQLAMAGVAYHHAGMLPIHKEIVERLFTSGLVRVLFATETFALGVNMPARTVAFLTLRKFDGEKVDYMLCRSYGQMAGRAGRQGIDTHGLVVSIIDPRHDRVRGVKRVTSGQTEPVRSRWNPDYSTLLAFYARMGERVVETYERSLARFQRLRRRGSGKGRSGEQRTLAARLTVLKKTGYIDKGELTDKGRFTSRVNGYEVHAGEWWDAGLMEQLDPEPLALLLLGAVYEPRPQDRGAPPRNRDLIESWTDARRRLAEFRQAEWMAGLTDLTPEPHFGLTAALEEWMGGAVLKTLGRATSAGEGDIVRNFRLLLQFLRQIRKALPRSDESIRRKLDRIREAVDRDEVDARRQLELGQDPVEESNEEGEVRSDEH